MDGNRTTLMSIWNLLARLRGAFSDQRMYPLCFTGPTTSSFDEKDCMSRALHERGFFLFTRGHCARRFFSGSIATVQHGHGSAYRPRI